MQILDRPDVEPARRLGRDQHDRVSVDLTRDDELLLVAAGEGAGTRLRGAAADVELLDQPPRVLMLDEPTRGVDVGAKAEVHKLVRKLADEGMATLLISSDLPEVLAMSDRILVMRGGTIAGDVSRAEATQERILSLAIPATSAEGAAA